MSIWTAERPKSIWTSGKPAASSPTDVNGFLQSLAGVESGGRYDALGPVINSGMYEGDRAYGKYQIMGKNVPAWTKQYLGTAMTPQQFLADQNAQERLMTARAQELYGKYGNWEDVASVHFTGQPKAQGATKKDQLGTSGAEYIAKVTGMAQSTPQLPTGGPDFLSDVVQAPFKATGKLLATAEEARTNKPTAFQPQGIQQRFMGSEPIPSIQQELPKVTRDIESLGLDPRLSSFAAAAATIGGPLLDLSPFGGSRKTAIQVLAKTQDVAETATHLRSMGVPEDLILDQAKWFAKQTDQTAIQQGLDHLEQLIRTTKPKPRVGASDIVQSSKLRQVSESQTARQQLPQTPPQPKEAQPNLSSLLHDEGKLRANATVNVSRLRTTNAGKELIAQTVEELQPKIEKSIGHRLSNKEAIELAENSSSLLTRVVTRQKTEEWEAAMLNARQSLAYAAQTGRVDKNFVDTLLAVKTQGTDIARKLQSMKIGADAKEVSTMQALVEAVLEVTKNADEVAAAARGVDFNDFRQAAEFYRRFVKPKMTDWIDLIRYNSMLSSPLTHFVNAFSNAINTTIVAPIEKALTGGLDFLGSAITGKERAYFAGESAAYTAAYFRNIKQAAHNFGEALSGRRAATNLDTRDIPIASSGAKGAVVKTLSIPMRLLEASDQFFTTLTQAGETAALELRKGKGATVGNIETAAADKAAYRLYRQELNPEDQGVLLDAVDRLTNLVYTARNSKNPLVSQIAKFTVPFIRTPMNIFKQGIEYSPIGYMTLIGAANKTEQLAKAITGTAVFAAASTLLMSGRITWSEPTAEADRNAFRAAGRQPYSVKIGNTWVSFQKLPPPIAFPLAMVALIDEQLRTKKLDQSTAELILSSIAKYGDFLADQSYAKSIGDLLSAFQGGESDWARVIGNVPQQFVPFRALGGWIARLIDDVQRKPDPEGTFIEKQVQLLMMNIPGLSQKVPARTDRVGKEIEAKNNEINAFSPVRTSTESPEEAREFEDLQHIRQLEREATVKNNLLNDQAEATWNEISQLPRPEMIARLKELRVSNRMLHDRIVDIGEAEKLGLTDKEKALKTATTDTRARYILDQLDLTKTPEERRDLIAQYRQKKILTDSVAARIRELKKDEEE